MFIDKHVFDILWTYTFYNHNLKIYIPIIDSILILKSISILQLCQISFSLNSKTTTNAPKTTSFKQTANIKENTTVSFNQETTEQIQNENESKDELVLAATLTGVGLLILMVSFCLLFIFFRKSKCFILNVYCRFCWVLDNVEYYAL